MNISYLKFVLLYAIYSFFLFNYPLFVKFISVLSPKTTGDFVFLSSVWVVAFLLTINFYLVLVRYKLIAMLFLIINSLAFYFIYNYNILIDYIMIQNVMATDGNEARDLISFKMLVFVGFFGILPAILVFFTKLHYNVKSVIKFISITLTCCLFLVAVNYIRFATFFRVNRGFEDLFVPFNYTNPIFVMVKNRFFTSNAEPEKMIDDLTADVNQKINIVLVVGETARKKNLGLYGYKRETTPYLAKQKNLKVLDAISCGTSTKISVPCIFQFNEGYESYLNSINKAGIYVKWYENNFGGCYGMCEGVNTFFSNHKKCEGSCPDSVIFDEFYKDLESVANKPRLFVLHLNGSHGPLYYKRYPKEFAKFQPECKTASVNECSVESLINAYDNSILYTDYLLANAIEKLEKSGVPSVLIYISDHGESLGENGIFLHGFPYALAPKEQKEIPFIIWSSFPLKVKPQEYNQKNVMQSVLFLLRAETKTSNKNANILE